MTIEERATALFDKLMEHDDLDPIDLMVLFGADERDDMREMAAKVADGYYSSENIAQEIRDLK